ncbi:MAG: arsenite efflux transporter metallochaperone ArsD [Bacilli bacterium]|nr:arsenite efflux transporter metallochaperone ArsD [Bacilli bacterium]
MKKMKIYEPAMCCSTGVCGVGVDSELLRISTVLNNLTKNGVIVDRYNLSTTPQEFVNNKKVSDFLNTKGVKRLPIIILDGEIVIEGRYPSNEEISELLDVPMSNFTKVESSNNNSCCSGGRCC